MSYIGQGLGQGKAERFIFTASGGETSVTLDDAGRGVAYTVGQVDVYLNGVKLVNGTDFTATSGSSITGLSALSASDVVEIVALDAFSPADTVSAASGGTFGDAVTITDASNNPLTLNRTTSDGDIQVFQKDGTTVGSIGAISGDLAIYSTTSGHKGFRLGNGAIVPVGNSGGADDAGTNLGGATSRFKDFWLSGGIYLGGTGAANYLDDYEEGTWTPAVSNGTITTSAGVYVKIGAYVLVSGKIGGFSDTTTAAALYINNAPFASSSTTGYASAGSIGIFKYVNHLYDQLGLYKSGGNTNLEFWSGRKTGDYTPVFNSHLSNAAAVIFFSCVYQAA